jgi:hypothetical protein
LIRVKACGGRWFSPTRALARRAALLAAFSVIGLALPAAASAAANPLLSGSVSNSTSLAGASAVAISGHYAYALGYYAGELVAIDVSNPADPTITGASAPSSALINGATVNVAGGYAYVVSKNRNASKTDDDDGTGNSLTILDIHTNPAVPAIVGTIRVPSELFGGYGVTVANGYAYVAGQGTLIGQPAAPDSGTGSFAVVNVSNPAAPTIVAHLDNDALPAPWTGSNALQHICSVFVSGHYAYVTAAYSNRLTIIDISNPAAPQIVGSSPALAFPVDVAVSGKYAYVANQTVNPAHPNFGVVDIADPANPKLVGTVRNPVLSGAYRIRLHGKFAYISAVYAASVSAIDITDPTHPVLAAPIQDSAHLFATTGLDVDPTGKFVVASSFFLPSQDEPLYPPFPPAPGSPTLTGTIATITLDPVAIAVKLTKSSEPALQTTRTSATFRFSVSDKVASVQCKLDRTPVQSCTGVTTRRYARLKRGSHTFTVQATNAAGRTVRARYRWTVRTPTHK